MRKISQLHKSLLLVAVSFVIFSSCASNKTNVDGLPESEAALLDESEKATPVMDDAAIFSDLNAAMPEGATVTASTENAGAGGDGPFYNPIGGESLGRVAYTLYGDSKKVKKLLSLNPNLAGVTALSPDQKVYFDLSLLQPKPTYLTKDLLDRYSPELARSLEGVGLPKETVTVSAGETLQAVSQRLYGTTRYWTEIYLLNQGTISHYDKVGAGVSLTVHQRNPLAPRPVVEQVAPAPAMDEVTPIQPIQTAQPAVQPIVPENNSATNQLTTQEISPMQMDPIPETPARPAVTPKPKALVPKENTKPQILQDLLGPGSSANVRRIIYVSLILLIGGVAFYMTRSSKKKKFDMLDVTTSDTAPPRPKFPGSQQDSHHQDIG